MSANTTTISEPLEEERPEQQVAGTYIIQNSRFAYVNSAFARIFGYGSPKEVVAAMRVYDLVSPNARRGVVYNAGCLSDDSTLNVRYCFSGLKQDGSTFDVEVHNSVVEHAGQRFVVGVAVDMSEIRRMTQRAFYDPLTSLPNRGLVFDRIQHALANAKRINGHVAVLFLDLNNFKPINDHHGHTIGDEVLATTAQRFSNALRNPDTIGRLGGDEFVVVLPNIARRNEAELVAKRLIETLATPITTSSGDFKVGVSVGIALYPEHGDDALTLYREADTAMYAAKIKNTLGYSFARRRKRLNN